MPATLTYTGVLVRVSCWCGIQLAIPQALYNTAHERRMDVYCPLGHVFQWGDSFEEQLARERRRVQATRDLLASEERSHAATRGHLTRQKKRIAAGVCPCCHRHFTNLERHMGAKHPDFATTKEAA